MYILIMMEGIHAIESCELLGVYNTRKEADQAVEQHKMPYRFFDIYYYNSVKNECELLGR